MVVEINNLPDEVLEFILSYLPPYKDLEECQLVCKRWNSIVKNVMRRSKMNLYKGLCDFRLCWKTNTLKKTNGNSLAPTIAGRFSHSAVIHENSMYIFGGGSSTDTTFNDLWRFDLSKRQWIRPLSMGSYPSPKGSATMVCYNNQLILFGGWRYPSLHPPYQPWCLFDELHLYDIKENRWILQTSVSGNGPPPMAGHSATIHRNQMVIFGGYQIDNEINSNSNDVWCLNLNTFTWKKPEVSNIKPPPRYGQFQIALNDTNLLIVGGCGGPNNMFSDAWVLNMSSDVWQWTNIPIKNKKWSATHMWCNPACRVGSKLVVLGPTPNLPCDFQILRQQRPGIVMNRLNQQNHPHNHNQEIRINYQNLLRLDDNLLRPQRNFRANNNNHFNINNNTNNTNNNNNNNNSNNSRSIELNNPQSNNSRSQQNHNVAAVAGNYQQQQHNQNNMIDDEAANRLQRNLALKCREDDAKLPKRFDEPFEDRFRMAAFNVHQPKSRNSSRERQLERVRRMEEKMNALRNSRRNNSNNINENNSNVFEGAVAAGDQLPASIAGTSSNSVNINSTNNMNNVNDNNISKKQEEPSPKRTKRNCLAMFVCDLSNILSKEPYLEWIEYKNYGIITGAPERLILSTIVAGNGELIMFGGVHKESLSEMTHQVSNSVHFLTAPKQII